MADTITISESDIADIGRKLDEFAAVLTSREHAVLFAALKLAGNAVRQEAARSATGGAGTSAGPSATGLPSLSEGFRNAFQPGIGGKFRIPSPSDAEGGAGIGVVWSEA